MILARYFRRTYGIDLRICKIRRVRIETQFIVDRWGFRGSWVFWQIRSISHMHLLAAAQVFGPVLESLTSLESAK